MNDYFANSLNNTLESMNKNLEDIAKELNEQNQFYKTMMQILEKLSEEYSDIKSSRLVRRSLKCSLKGDKKCI